MQSTVTEINPERWVHSYGDYLYNYALSRLYSKDLAEDILQETFLYAWQSRDSFSGKSTERTWLISILKRKIADHYRKKATKKEQGIEFNTPFIQGDFLQGKWNDERAPHDWGVDEDDLSKDENFMRSIRQCISHLPDKWKAVFTLKHIEELTNNEICEMLDMSDNNIWTILHRSRLRLRACIENLWFKKI